MDKHLNDLVQLLARLGDAYETLLVCLRDRKEAIRTADHRAMAPLNERERAIHAVIRSLESQRAAVTKQIAAAWGMASGEELTLSQIAMRIEPADRDRLRAERDRLQGIAKKVQLENALIGKVTQTLLSHVSGVMGQVRAMLSTSGMYDRKGAANSPSELSSSFSIQG